MKCAFVASEALPHAKTGGLADVVGTLPVHLRKYGIETSVFMPRYRGMRGSPVTRMTIEMDKKYDADIYREGDFLFISNPAFFDRSGLYGTEKGDFPDNCERFTFFCKAVAGLIKSNKYDIVHCHDWQTGLVPLYMHMHGMAAKAVFTIHNLGYQGQFPASKFPLLGVDDTYFTPNGVEFFGNVNLLKAGIVYSDVVTTVSENYAREIQTPELGFGLDGVLRKKGKNIVGIINGIDYDEWNPRTDTLLYTTYSHAVEKQDNKIRLGRDCSLDVQKPLIGMVSRIADQKGFNIIMKVFDAMMIMGFSFIVLGFGDERYHDKLRAFEKIYNGRVSVNIKFDNTLAHRIYAGSDFFLMPSQYEPCGLGQLISLRYGTVPIVRKTGGLADTITDFDLGSHSGNGFVFEEYSSAALLDSLSRAYTVYGKKEVFNELAEHCMGYNFSWEESAKKYKQLYESLSPLH